MIAAIYARKSTEQDGADADAKSVARQLENARAFALAKGWRVPDRHAYSDDAISGAETKKLVNRQRLLGALDATPPPFQVLIMRDASRFSRRDGDEAFGELKRIAQRGIEIWFYQDGGSRFAFGNFGDNVVGFVRAEMNAEYRRQIAKWTSEAMMRKAKQGHSTGGSTFGYTNIQINGHTERRINEAEAKVVRRIFSLCGSGYGYTAIAKQLSAERAVTPRQAPGRVPGWSPSSVSEVLRREAYRGQIIYNRRQRRDNEGGTTMVLRPESEWIRVERPDLRVVTAAAWSAAHARIDGARRQVASVVDGGARRHRRDIKSRFLLSGFVRCAMCGGGISALAGRSYGCISYHKRGSSVCANGLRLPIATLDEAVLKTLREDVLRPAAVKAIIDGVFVRLAAPNRVKTVSRSRADLSRLDAQIAHLTDAIAEGGHLPPLLDALQQRQAQREDLRATLAQQDATAGVRYDRATIERKVQHAVSDWRQSLTAHSVRSRQVLREILAGPMTLTPDGRSYRFEGEDVVGRLLLGKVGLPTFNESPGRSAYRRLTGR